MPESPRDAAALRLRVRQLEASLHALRSGDVDALVVPGDGGDRLYTLHGADRAYRLLVEQMSEGALTVSASGIVIYANRRFAELLGRPLSRVIGTPVARCFAPECQAALAALLSEGGAAPRSVELDLLTETQVRVPMLLSLSRLAAEGLPDASCMVATDLTAQRRSEAAALARRKLLAVIEAQRKTEQQLQQSLATLRLHDNALGAISQGVLIADAQRRTTYVNPAFEAISGYSAAEMAGRTCALMQGPDTDPATLRALAEALNAEQPFHGALLNYRKDGTPFWNELTVTPVFDAHGVLTQYVGVQRDITARRHAEAQRLLSAQVFEQSSEGFIITDPQANIVKVNSAFSAISGYSEAEALGQNPRMLNSGRHDDAFHRAIWGEMKTHGRWQGEIWNRRKDGSVYPQWLSMSRAVDAAGAVTHYIGSFSDITQRKAAENSIRQLAHYDSLTGLPNRVLLSDRATHALQMAHRSGRPMALMFIDLDHFKHVNDSLGHRVGDSLLVAMAARMRSALREQDTLSRVGGDEFVLVLPDTDADGAAHVANKLVQVAQTPFQIEQNELTITPSIGVALYPLDGTDFDTLSKCADAAMYRAKQDGRNTFCFYTSEMQAQSARALQLENALRRALQRGEMTLHYQPQRALNGRQIIGVEALLRWQHPELGSVSPAEFIPIAESSGLISGIGEWVLRAALRQLRRWMDDGMAPMIMAVNLSAVQFRQQNLPDLVAQILEQEGVAAQYLELELTEGVASHDPLAAMAAMDRLHACGVHMSIDDFGTGYSSLSYLKRFKVYKLKIDQSFVRNVIGDSEDQAIVTAIISLARSLGLRTIAEGVETAAQMACLSRLGCDEMQGYWLSRPLPVERVEAFLLDYAQRGGE